MNETQRQILADRIDELMRDIEWREEGIEKSETHLARAKARLKVVKDELEQLQEGVDW